ncbi:hypothetical protein [Roseateles koreensis]|uniref:PBP domain-containing protein n=1 Tax=Roseateles koreensis TaxID=2987526 RepID=A0ABT5KMB5_9BURK|nr:hypothetical protein [Roseateles koreensis]MDC8784050.1 hypothetical protein [Roseateles koreensis]
MKIRSIALAAAALVGASSAFAAPAVNVNSSSTVKIYLAGSSALRLAVAGIVGNDVCGGASAASVTLYNIAADLTTISGNDWAITCNAASGNTLGLTAGTPVAFFKTDAGGSAQGVFPIAANTAIPFVNVADVSKCTMVTADHVYTGCPVTDSKVPNFGISDLEPGMFKGINVPNDQGLGAPTYSANGLSAGDISALSITPVVQTVFGVVVNDNLYADMFDYQGLSAKKDASGVACTTTSTDETCIPSIGQAVARTVFTGAPSWNLLVKSTAAKVGTQFNICRRVQGSGTQTAANLQFGAYGCSNNSLTSLDVNASTSAAPDFMSAWTGKTVNGNLTPINYARANMGGTSADGITFADGTMPTGGVFVFEGPGTGDVVSCINSAQKAGGYAIGHVSKENIRKSTDSWKHIRVEGAYPTSTNAKGGNYDYVVESTMQYGTSALATLGATQQLFVKNFVKAMGKPATLNYLSAGSQQGVLTLSNSYTDADPTLSADANVVKFGSRVTRLGNSCNPLTRAN